jgi:hypothetical protein
MAMITKAGNISFGRGLRALTNKLTVQIINIKKTILFNISDGAINEESIKTIR